MLTQAEMYSSGVCNIQSIRILSLKVTAQLNAGREYSYSPDYPQALCIPRFIFGGEHMPIACEQRHTLRLIVGPGLGRNERQNLRPRWSGLCLGTALSTVWPIPLQAPTDARR